MGIKPETRSAFFSRYSRISRFFSAGTEVPSGSVGEPAMSSESIRSIPIRST